MAQSQTPEMLRMAIHVIFNFVFLYGIWEFRKYVFMRKCLLQIAWHAESFCKSSNLLFSDYFLVHFIVLKPQNHHLPMQSIKVSSF
jgi:hypothetical protein